MDRELGDWQARLGLRLFAEQSVCLQRPSGHREKLTDWLLEMDKHPEVQRPHHRAPESLEEEGRRGTSGKWGMLGDSLMGSSGYLQEGWAAVTLNDMCHQCLVPAQLQGSVTVIGSGGCRGGSSSGGSAIIVGGPWKRRERALRSDLGSPFHQPPPLLSFLPLTQPWPPSSLSKISVPVCSPNGKSHQGHNLLTRFRGSSPSSAGVGSLGPLGPILPAAHFSE